jgi:Putative beta-lactamase-inhibitor-like, PepSY-like
MKKTILFALVALSAFAFTSCDNDDYYVPSTKLTTTLTTMFPTASFVEWEKERNYIKAEFLHEGAETEVRFSTNEEWLQTEIDLQQNQIPAPVVAAIAQSEFANWQYEDAHHLQQLNADPRFVIEMENANKDVDLHFSAEGELLQTIYEKN